MSLETVVDTPVEVDFSASQTENPVLVDQLSQPLVGKWNSLVSQTNWEKGTLILNWRNELQAAGQPNTIYSDECWARRVGNVTAQHVGRLRRTAERFADKHNDFAGLYWSHFYTALDWEDAEQWLEGAVQNDWSVAQMQVQRWDTLGIANKHNSQGSEVFVADWDEEPDARQMQDGALPHSRIEGRTAEIGAADAVEGFDASTIEVYDSLTDSPKPKEPKKTKTKLSEQDADIPSAGELINRLKGITEFPSDLAEPLELLKIAILNHQVAGWKEVSAEQICKTLETLKLLTTAQ